MPPELDLRWQINIICVKFSFNRLNKSWERSCIQGNHLIYHPNWNTLKWEKRALLIIIQNKRHVVDCPPHMISSCVSDSSELSVKTYNISNKEVMCTHISISVLPVMNSLFPKAIPYIKGQHQLLETPVKSQNPLPGNFSLGTISFTFWKNKCDELKDP